MSDDPPRVTADDWARAREIEADLARVDATLESAKALIASVRIGPPIEPPRVPSEPWDRVRRQIQALARETSADGWDIEGGRAVVAALWERALPIVDAARDAGLAPPFVSACGDGSVHLVWTSPAGDRQVLELAPDGDWWTCMPASGDDHVEEYHA